MLKQDVLKYFLLLVFGYLFGKIMWPFVGSFVFAVLFAVMFYPVFFKAKKWFGENGGAGAVLFATLFFIFAPIVVLITLLAKEITGLVINTSTADLVNAIESFDNYEIFGYRIDLDQITALLKSAMQSVGQVALDVSKAAGANTIEFLFAFFVFIFMYFYMLRDGQKLLKKLKEILPFSKSQNQKLVSDFHHVTKAVFVGNLLGALFSGVAAYVGFLGFGIGGAVIWALMAGILSLIPTVGTLFIYIAGALMVFATYGWVWGAAFVLYFLSIEVGLVQNLIKPKFLDDKISVHPILVFLALVGGVEVFGSIGFVYGPLIVVLFVAIFQFSIESKN